MILDSGQLLRLHRDGMIRSALDSCGDKGKVLSGDFEVTSMTSSATGGVYLAMASALEQGEENDANIKSKVKFNETLLFPSSNYCFFIFVYLDF